MNSQDQETPVCFIIAGPNGAGKTTFAREFLLKELQVVHFINADLIAAGLSPFDSSLVELKAGRLFLQELKHLAETKINFAFETTLSGLSYLPLLKRWKKEGYRIEIIYLRLKSPSLALERVASRVKQGGHDIPKATILRRFDRGWENFLKDYRPLADGWSVYENSECIPHLLEKRMKPTSCKKREQAQDELLVKIERALLRAGEQARKIARFHGTSIHIMKDGKIVAIKP